VGQHLPVRTTSAVNCSNGHVVLNYTLLQNVSSATSENFKVTPNVDGGYEPLGPGLMRPA